jgi:ribosome-binding ATPase YchF (GTP1/OBG family)
VASRLLSDSYVKTEIDRQISLINEELELTDSNIIKRLWQEATTAQRSADRTNALTQLARIKGLMKDTPTQSIAIFNSIEKELRQIQPISTTQAIDTQADTTASMLT